MAFLELQNVSKGFGPASNRYEVLKDANLTGPGPNLGIMFQNYSLLPWLSVTGNLEIAVKQVFPGSG